jgi:hypothetical protein
MVAQNVYTAACSACSAFSVLHCFDVYESCIHINAVIAHVCPFIFFSCVLTRREAFSLLYLNQLDPCSSQAMGRTGVVRTGKTTKEKRQPVARKRPATAKGKVTRKKASDSASSAQKQRLLYPRWIDIQDDHIEPSAFATKVAQHYAAKGFSMTAVNVQSLIAEAEDALASMNRLNSSHTKYVLQYMAVQLEYMFGRKSHKWLSELRRMHDRC